VSEKDQVEPLKPSLPRDRISPIAVTPVAVPGVHDTSIILAGLHPGHSVGQYPTAGELQAHKLIDIAAGSAAFVEMCTYTRGNRA